MLYAPSPSPMPGTQQTTQAPCHPLALPMISSTSWNLIWNPLGLSCPFLSLAVCHAAALPPECLPAGPQRSCLLPLQSPSPPWCHTAYTALPHPAGCITSLVELELLTCLSLLLPQPRQSLQQDLGAGPASQQSWASTNVLSSL